MNIMYLFLLMMIVLVISILKKSKEDFYPSKCFSCERQTPWLAYPNKCFSCERQTLNDGLIHSFGRQDKCYSC